MKLHAFLGTSWRHLEYLWMGNDGFLIPAAVGSQSIDTLKMRRQVL